MQQLELNGFDIAVFERRETFSEKASMFHIEDPQKSDDAAPLDSTPVLPDAVIDVSEDPSIDRLDGVQSELGLDQVLNDPMFLELGDEPQAGIEPPAWVNEDLVARERIMDDDDQLRYFDLFLTLDSDEQALASENVFWQGQI